MSKKNLEIYTTFLASQSGQATATKLSFILNKKISHDKITRFLHEEKLGEHTLWKSANKNNSIVKNLEKAKTDLITWVTQAI